MLRGHSQHRAKQLRSTGLLQTITCLHVLTWKVTGDRSRTLCYKIAACFLRFQEYSKMARPLREHLPPWVTTASSTSSRPQGPLAEALPSTPLVDVRPLALARDSAGLLCPLPTPSPGPLKKG